MTRGDGPITNVRGEKVALGPLERELLPEYRACRHVGGVAHILLGPLERELLPEYRRWINDPNTRRTLGGPPLPITAEQEESWYDASARSESEATFTVYALPDLRPIGTTGLHGIDYGNRSATFGIVLGAAEYRGRGLGTETTGLMLDYAFTALGLHNVMLSVFEFNHAGLRAYEKAGFREIGRRRECRAMGGKLWDEILMDILSTEFESPVLAEVFVSD